MSNQPHIPRLKAGLRGGECQGKNRPGPQSLGRVSGLGRAPTPPEPTAASSHHAVITSQTPAGVPLNVLSLS